MASETVDPIDWSHPPPYTGQYLLSSMYCTVQCGLQITRLTALTRLIAANVRPSECQANALPVLPLRVFTQPDLPSFLFVGDLNGHHQEWLGSTTTKRHGVATFDFATVSVCEQLVVGPTHALFGTLDLLMTDVPDLVRVAVVAPIGNSNHSSMSAVISMAQAVANLCVSWKVSSNIKSTGIQSVVQYRICPGVTFGLLTILFRF